MGRVMGCVFMGSTHGFGKLRRVAPPTSPDEVVASSAPVPELESKLLCQVSSVRCFVSPGAWTFLLH